MYIVITSLELRSPWKFFKLSYFARAISIQVKKESACKAFKTTGFWTLHYTMTAWDDLAQMQAFSRSGAHLQGMKKSAELAKEIRILRYEAEKLPNWKEAKALLKNQGRVLPF